MCGITHLDLKRQGPVFFFYLCKFRQGGADGLKGFGRGVAKVALHGIGRDAHLFGQPHLIFISAAQSLFHHFTHSHNNIIVRGLV